MHLINAKQVTDTKLEKPFRLIVGGGSGSGKTEFVKKLVQNDHFSSPFDKIIYCYPEYLTEIPAEFSQIVEHVPGLPNDNYFATLEKNTLIILDDMMTECGNSTSIMKLFSVIARKRNLSIIFIVQNIYDNSKQFRNIRLNATGFVLFKFYAATDVTQRILRDLGIKELISKKKLDEIYSSPFAYIMIDAHPMRHSQFATIKSNIFDDNFSIYNHMEYVAIPKAEFVKYFKIIEAKSDSIKAIKNEIAIKKSNKRKRKRRRSPTPDSTYVIKRFNIPKGSTNVMLPNLMTGPLPGKLFWGIQTMESYGGSFHSSSTRFNRNGMIKANLYKDGKEVDDYPIRMTGTHVMEPFVKYLENTNQQLNGFLSRTLCDREFKDYHFVLSKSFDPTQKGVLSFEFDFQNAVTEDLVLITCGLYNKTLKLDHNRNFQII